MDTIADSIEYHFEKYENSIKNDFPKTNKKIIALKEIDFSNSIIESFNKLLKYRFLFTRKLHNYEDTVKYLNQAIPVYNSVRPHGTNYFYGLTPEQRLNGEKRNRKELRELFENARKLRVKTNRKAGCPVCIG